MLRAAEEAKKPKEVSEKAKALQAYLAAQYGDGGGGGESKKKKKKKKEAGTSAVAAVPGGGMRILDQDVSGFGHVSGGGGGARGRAAGPRTLDESEEEDGACPLPCGAAAASLAPFSRCCLCCG